MQQHNRYFVLVFNNVGASIAVGILAISAQILDFRCYEVKHPPQEKNKKNIRNQSGKVVNSSLLG